jgi:hypothetical protein
MFVNFDPVLHWFCNTSSRERERERERRERGEDREIGEGEIERFYI